MLYEVITPLGLTPNRIPTDLISFLTANHPEDLNTRAITEIESLSTKEKAINYKIKGTEIKDYIDYLKSFL